MIYNGSFLDQNDRIPRYAYSGQNKEVKRVYYNDIYRDYHSAFCLLPCCTIEFAESGQKSLLCSIGD